MIVKWKKVNPLAQAALVEIQAAGVEITPDIVLSVQDAAEAIRKTPLRPVADLVDWPVMAGGAALYPLTFGAVSWLMRLPERMRNDVRVIAFACAHTKQPDTLIALSGVLPTIAAVLRWSMRLTCSYDALSAAVDEVLGLESYAEITETIKRKRDPESIHWGAAVRALCTKYPGTTPSYWTWDVGREYAYAMIQQVNEELPDDARVSDYEIEANATFRNLVEHLKRGTGEPTNGE